MLRRAGLSAAAETCRRQLVFYIHVCPALSILAGTAPVATPLVGKRSEIIRKLRL